MTITPRFLIAISALNVACTAVSVSQLPHAHAARADVSDVVRTRHLEVVDVDGRVRASITVHPANRDVRLPDGTTQEDSVVLRLVNADGGPGVKLASSQHSVGLALIAKQGDYLQVFGDGVKVTKDFKQRAAWP
jgi:hypothetical protein